MKKKKILFWGLAVLLVAAVILAVTLSVTQSCSNKSDNPPNNNNPSDDPSKDPGEVEDPEYPDHKHTNWVWQATVNEHWQYPTCHPSVILNRGPHVYDNDKDEECNTCHYVRSIPIDRDKIKVEIKDGTATVGGYDDPDEHVEDLVIPGTVTDADGNEYTVEEITDDAFKGDQTLTSLTILEGVKRISKGAFKECSKLEKIVIPSTVEEIDPEAFYNCKSLKEIKVNDNPVYRDYQNCLIERATRCVIIGCKTSVIPIYPENGTNEYIVTSIGEGAFYGSGIESIVIPSNVTSIGAHAFHNCASLTEITIPESITAIRNHTFNSCTALTTVNLHNGITEIGQNAFAGCSKLDGIVIPANVTKIDTNTFKDCTSLKSITLSDNLTAIGSSAFSGCSQLANITLPSSIGSIGTGAFSGCTKFTSLVIPDSVTSIANGAFTGCKNLESISVDEGNTVYTSSHNCLINIEEKRIILGCKASTIPTEQVNGEYIVTSIGESAFYGSGITSITIPSNITSIGARAFQNCTSLDSIVLPEGLTAINANTFYGCTSLKSITLPSSISSIGSGAFGGCTNLESITLPSSVTDIGSGAFGGCTKLAEIIYDGTEEEWNENVTAQDGWNPLDAQLKFRNN